MVNVMNLLRDVYSKKAPYTYVPDTPVSYTHLDVYKRQGLDFTLEGKLNTFHATVYARESKIDPTTHTLTIRALYPLSLIHISSAPSSSM